jgi:hypothetical protein
MKWLSDILTDDAGHFTPDKVALVAGVLIYNGLAIYDVVVHKTPFIANATNYGVGLGAVLAAGGGAMWLASRQKSSGNGQ